MLVGFAVDSCCTLGSCWERPRRHLSAVLLGMPTLNACRSGCRHSATWRFATTFTFGHCLTSFRRFDGLIAITHERARVTLTSNKKNAGFQTPRQLVFCRPPPGRYGFLFTAKPALALGLVNFGAAIPRAVFSVINALTAAADIAFDIAGLARRRRLA